MRLLRAWILVLLVSAGCSNYVATGPMLPRPLLAEVEDVGLADEPTLARTGDGSLYVAWVSFRSGVDTLQVARYVREQNGFTRLGEWNADGGDGVAVLSPRAASGSESVFIVYSAEREGNWDIYAVECGPSGPGKPIRVSTHSATDFSPDAVQVGANLYVVWETNRGGERHIMFDTVVGGSAQVPQQVSEGGTNNYDPAIAAAGTGSVAIAWHSWRNDNYDIYFRQRQPSGRWNFERRLSFSPGIDRNAALATSGDDIWIAYESSGTAGYATGTAVDRRLVIGKVATDGLQAPLEPAPAGLVEGGREPAIAFDPGGRLWVAFLRPGEGEQSQWYVHLGGFTGASWVAPVRVAAGKGLNRRPALQLLEDEAVTVFQNDDFPETGARNDVSVALLARSWVVLGAVGLAGIGPNPIVVPVEPLQEPEPAFEAAGIRTALGGDMPDASLDYGGERLELFFGDLHAHSDISDGLRIRGESVSEAYQSRRDIHGLSFVAITDHGYDLTPSRWSYSAKQVRANEDPGRFLTLLAQEWTSGRTGEGSAVPPHPYGHRNLIFAGTRISDWWNAFSGQTPEQLWNQLETSRTNFLSIPNRLADAEDAPVDWSFADERYQPVAEIYEERGSYESVDAPSRARGSAAVPGDYLQDAWQRGVIIGVVASPGYGGGAAKAGVWAEQLTRDSILEAIRARHTFATTGARLMFDVRVNGHLMGEKAPAPTGPVNVEIRLSCPNNIARVEILRNNQVIHSAEPGGRSAEIAYVDRQPLRGTSHYYVRVTQADDQMAWSSPVWFEAR